MPGAAAITRITLRSEGAGQPEDPVAMPAVSATVNSVYHPNIGGHGTWRSAVVAVFYGFTESTPPTGGGNSCF